jgi:hypothetical protein
MRTPVPREAVLQIPTGSLALDNFLNVRKRTTGQAVIAANHNHQSDFRLSSSNRRRRPASQSRNPAIKVQ